MESDDFRGGEAFSSLTRGDGRPRAVAMHDGCAFVGLVRAQSHPDLRSALAVSALEPEGGETEKGSGYIGLQA